MTTRSGGKINISESSKEKLKELKTTQDLIKEYNDYNRGLKNEIVQETNSFIDTVIPNSEKYEAEIERKKIINRERKEFLLREIVKLSKNNLSEMDKYYLSEKENAELESDYRKLKENHKSFFRRLVELFI